MNNLNLDITKNNSTFTKKTGQIQSAANTDYNEFETSQVREISFPNRALSGNDEVPNKYQFNTRSCHSPPDKLKYFHL